MPSNTINIAVDCGKHTTKALCKLAGNLQPLTFRTKMKLVEDFGGDLAPNNFLVQQNANTYLIGDMVSEASTNYNISKQSDDYKFCIYLAICCFLEKLKVPAYTVSNINLAINMPLTLFKNETHKNNLKQYIANDNKPIQLYVNSKHYTFRIDNLTIVPEAVGSIYASIAEYRNKRINLIDIGSLNVSYTTYNNLTPSFESMASSQSGINIIRSKISETLTTKYNTLISDADVEYILKTDKYVYIEGVKQLDSKPHIEQLLLDHVHEILSFAKSRSYTFNNCDLIFCGGGALLLKDYILKLFPLAKIDVDSQFANVRSFLKILEVKYGHA